MPISGCILWFTGLSASGKTTLCTAVADSLLESGVDAVVLDGDVLRQTLCRDLGFSRKDREENIRRIAALAFERVATGSVVLVAAISPYRESRDQVRRLAPVPILEIFVDAPLEVCEQRDPKGLYRRARSGELPHFTGIDDVYEEPEHPDIHCRTAFETVEESRDKIMTVVKALRINFSPP